MYRFKMIIIFVIIVIYLSWLVSAIGVALSTESISYLIASSLFLITFPISIKLVDLVILIIPVLPLINILLAIIVSIHIITKGLILVIS